MTPRPRPAPLRQTKLGSFFRKPPAAAVAAVEGAEARAGPTADEVIVDRPDIGDRPRSSSAQDAVPDAPSDAAAVDAAAGRRAPRDTTAVDVVSDAAVPDDAAPEGVADGAPSDAAVAGARQDVTTEASTADDAAAHGGARGGSSEDADADAEDAGGLCAYDVARAARIKRNDDYLKSLGLGGGFVPLTVTSRKRQSKKRATSQTDAPRRSRRLRSDAAHETADGPDDAAAAPRAEPEEAPVIEVDSDAKSYLLAESGESAAGAAAKTEFFDAALKRVYALASLGGAGELFAAAGKNARISLFSPGRADPVVSFKAGSGWIGGLAFVRRFHQPALLLTAGNDGRAVLWDASVSPPRSVSTLQAHPSGAWTLDYAETSSRGATGGKDGAVCIFDISTFRLSEARRFEGASDHGAVKDVRWCPAKSFLLSTAADDGTVRVWDLRSSQSVLRADAHSRATSARWRPDSENELLSCGDGKLKLWDLRRTHEPLVVETYSGHGASSKQIRHPEWLCVESFVVPGNGTQRCTFFDVSKARPHAHVVFEADATVVAPFRADKLLVALENGTIRAVDPPVAAAYTSP
ncbi:WD40-repeat-containing domain protein [Pelagophyceae sp. CCMP2097]|nr:WD40-repeat-containing domain protein [Pelagophyceae sp. CCMP2097]